MSDIQSKDDWARIATEYSANLEQAKIAEEQAQQRAKIDASNDGVTSTANTIAVNVITAQVRGIESVIRFASDTSTQASNSIEPRASSVPLPTSTEVLPYVPPTIVNDITINPPSVESGTDAVNVTPVPLSTLIIVPIDPNENFNQADQQNTPPITSAPSTAIIDQATIDNNIRYENSPTETSVELLTSGVFDASPVPLENPPNDVSVEVLASGAPNASPLGAPPFDEFAGLDDAISLNQSLGELGINTDLPAGVNKARNSDTAISTAASKNIKWWFTLSLSPEANYLYKDPNIKNNPRALLYPLIATNGVKFPYTPKIDVTYQANYDVANLLYTNYKFYTYQNSSVETIQITADFTAQDTNEASYMLAVIHFFRSVTKMFYGKDQNPTAGIPPPLCYLSGHGAYMFDNHPVLIHSFSLNLPNDIDYINAKSELAGTFENRTLPTYNKPIVGPSSRESRLAALLSGGVAPGGVRPSNQKSLSIPDNINELTRVPTRLSVNISAYPVITRNDLSNNFSLEGYARGDLLKSNRKKTNGKPSFGGFW
jgi:hypothetical protein